MARTFQLAGQRAELIVIDVRSGERRTVLSSNEILFEAPNWTPDGQWLIVNGDGRLFRVPANETGGGDESLEEIPLGGIPEINNDHVLSPDGRCVYVSAEDGHIYAVPLDGGAPDGGAPEGGAQRRVTSDTVSGDAVSGDTAPGLHHYLHGVSPDGQTLAFIGLTRDGAGNVRTNVFTVPASGGAETAITDDSFPDDGAEFTRDGKRILFNSERGSSAAGHAQLFAIGTEGSGIEKLTDDERVNWFPHESPDGTEIAYVSFPPGTLGHPADVPVIIRILGADGGSRDLAEVFGGQGTMNVPSWSPDSRYLAYAGYPVP
jgi:Tol biopolymer transport system component